LFQYTGQVYLRSTGLYHYKLRTYDPETGRFLQADPIGYLAGMNVYAYVGGDPVNFVDPLGLEGCDFACRQKNQEARAAARSLALDALHFWATRETALWPAWWTPPSGALGTGGAETEAGGVSAASAPAIPIGIVRPQAGPLVKPGILGGIAWGPLIAIAGVLTPSNLGDGTLVGAEVRRLNQAGGPFLVRFGAGPEDALTLATQAAAAESAGFPHGVSTKLVYRVSASLLQKGRVAPLAVARTQFDVRQTGGSMSHYTVVLPHPVNAKVAGKFNAVFIPR
jgi:RHS repeat-associated protein